MRSQEGRQVVTDKNREFLARHREKMPKIEKNILKRLDRIVVLWFNISMYS